MNLITVILKTSPHCLQFHYDKYDDALQAHKKFIQSSNPTILIEDEYGAYASIAQDQIAATFITDLTREMLAHEEVEVAKHRKDIRISKNMQREQQSGVITPRNVISN